MVEDCSYPSIFEVFASVNTKMANKEGCQYCPKSTTSPLPYDVICGRTLPCAIFMYEMSELNNKCSGGNYANNIKEIKS
jgi:hypothetical protein